MLSRCTGSRTINEKMVWRNMNWLAHVFLSENSIDYQLGNLLADPLKGKLWEGASDEIKRGLKMHQKIDAYTDQHEMFLLSKSRLGKKGYLKGVVVDLVYDHLLTLHWNKYSMVSLAEFLSQFHLNAIDASQRFPEKPKETIRRIVAADMLSSYSTIDGLEQAFARVDARLSERILKKENTLSYLNVVKQEMPNLDADFQIFFPDLMSRVFSVYGGEFEHWLNK